MDYRFQLQNRKIKERERPLVTPSRGPVRVCVIYPNRYEVAMSSLSFHYVYSALNSFQELTVERCYLPGRDSMELAVSKYIPSFESSTPLMNFDILAFTVSYEPDFINVLRILKLARIPLKARERSGTGFPLVVAGGSACYQNILPLAETVDVFCLGEGEMTVPALVGTYLRNVSRPGGAANAPALTVESLERADNFLCGERLRSLAPGAKIRCAMTNDPDFAVSAFLTPDTEFSDMALVEIQRGCVRRCRFCMVGNCYGRFRPMPAERLEKFAAAVAHHTKKIGLMGPAVSAHPQIERIQSFLSTSGFDVSMSSVYVDELPESTLTTLGSGSSRNATFGIESPDEEIRAMAGKRLSDESVFSRIGAAAAAGMRSLKLYFIIGLYDYFGRDGASEAADIARFLEKCLEAAGKGGDAKLKVSVNPLIIKPRTPFYDDPGAMSPEFAGLYSGPEYIGLMQERYKAVQAAFRKERGVEFTDKSFDEAALMKIMNECKTPLFDFFDDLFYNENQNTRRVLKIMTSAGAGGNPAAGNRHLPDLEFYYGEKPGRILA